MADSKHPLIRAVRERFHPLFYARKSTLGRFVIRLLDRPVWLSIPGVSFRVRGRLLTHGSAYSAVGSQEFRPEALLHACLGHFRIASFWDVGSNIGYYAWLMKSAVPEIELVLIEPLATNAELIRVTLERARFANATLIVAGASDHAGEGILRVDRIAGMTSSLLETGGPTFEERHMGVPAQLLTIPLVMIDDVREGRAPIDFMKIDVEKHEESVIRGARETIFRDQPIIFIECEHPGHSCLEPLRSQGYRIVDADHLSIECSDGAQNFFCFPERYAELAETILQTAQSRLR